MKGLRGARFGCMIFSLCLLAGAGKRIELGRLKPRDLILENGLYIKRVSSQRKVIFTIDPRLQAKAIEIFSRYRVPEACLVVISSKTGRVLSFIGYSLKEGLSFKPCLKASAPAASIFKIITASCLLQEGKVSLSTNICYHGGIRKIYYHHLEDNPRRDYLCTSFGRALGFSLNAVFAKLTHRYLTPRKLKRMSERFGFNKRIRFELPVEISKATIPSQPLAIARVAAGFWHVYLSPLHAASIAQTIANKGVFLQPTLIQKITSKNQVVYKHTPTRVRQVISQRIAFLIRKMMVITTTQGTSRKYFFNKGRQILPPNIQVAGKTGSLHGRNPFKAYSWFVGIAPFNSPKISLSVLIINGPKWRIKSSYVAREIFYTYFKSQRS
jgi:cell division protein FtsI/penicillin-binding protein 2